MNELFLSFDYTGL